MLIRLITMSHARKGVRLTQTETRDFQTGTWLAYRLWPKLVNILACIGTALDLLPRMHSVDEGRAVVTH